MATTVTALTAHLTKIMPKGYATNTTPFTDWVTEAINETLAMASPEFRERVWTDCFGDGITTRFALPGFDVSILPTNQWTYPHFLNSAGIANPTAAPTVVLHSGGSTTPAGAVIFAGYSWITANGETQQSPLSSVTTAVANQTVDVTIPAAPIGVTGANLFTTIGVTNPQYTGRVSSNIAVSTSATTTTASLGLGAATVATLPLVDYLDPTTVSFDEGSVSDGLPDLEFNEDVTGRVTTDLTPTGVQTVIVFATAPATGKRVRVWYLRCPQLPANAGSAILGVPDDFLYTGTAAFMHRYLAMNHETGAKDQHWAAYLDMHNLLMQMKSIAAARATVPARVVQWSAQTV